MGCPEGDWPLVGALVLNLIARIERRQERMLAKIQAAAAQSRPGDGTGDAQPDCGGHDETSGAASPGEQLAPPAASACGLPEPEPTNPSDLPADQPTGSAKVKGHGRNGAGAYTAAHHVWYALAAGILGMVCERCEAGRMSRYREKVVIRIVGQPLLEAILHHYEQARCKIGACRQERRPSVAPLPGPGALRDPESDQLPDRRYRLDDRHARETDPRGDCRYQAPG
jgi:hypothetical protein